MASHRRYSMEKNEFSGYQTIKVEKLDNNESLMSNQINESDENLVTRQLSSQFGK